MTAEIIDLQRVSENAYAKLLAAIGEEFDVYVFEDVSGRTWIEFKLLVEDPSDALLCARTATALFDCDLNFRELATKVAAAAGRYYRPAPRPDAEQLAAITKAEALGFYVSVIDEPDLPLWIDYPIPADLTPDFIAASSEVSGRFHNDPSFRALIIARAIAAGRYRRSDSLD